MSKFFVGLDLGQKNDYTAICVLERVVREPDEDPVLPCRHLERFRHLPYPDVVEHVAGLLGREPLKSATTELVVDCTGVGDAVADLFRKRGVPFKGVKIHGGDTEHFSEDLYRVPKRNLISDLLVAYETGRFKTVASLEHAETLGNELVNFKMKINVATGHDSYEAAWREGIHDDLVLAAALAVWGVGRRAMPVDPEAVASSDPGGGFSYEEIARGLAEWQDQSPGGMF